MEITGKRLEPLETTESFVTLSANNIYRFTKPSNLHFLRRCLFFTLGSLQKLAFLSCKAKLLAPLNIIYRPKGTQKCVKNCIVGDQEIGQFGRFYRVLFNSP